MLESTGIQTQLEQISTRQEVILQCLVGTDTQPGLVETVRDQSEQLRRLTDQISEIVAGMRAHGVVV